MTAKAFGKPYHELALLFTNKAQYFFYSQVSDPYLLKNMTL